MEPFDGDKLDREMKAAYQKIKDEAVGAQEGKCINEEDMVSYLENGLAQNERDRVESHLAICSRCSEYVIVMNRVRSVGEEERVPQPSEKALQRVMALSSRHGPKSSGLQVLFAKVKELFHPRGFFPVRAFAGAGVACLLVLILLSRQGEMPGGTLNAIITVKPAAHADSAYSYGPKGTTLTSETFTVPEKGKLRPGDLYQLSYRTDVEAYVYVFKQDTSGSFTQLSPLPGETAKVSKRVEHILPENDKWFTADVRAGRITICIIATHEPQSDTKQLIENLNMRGPEKVKEEMKSVIVASKIISFTVSEE